MLTQVNVFNSRDAELSLPLFGDDLPYPVRNVAGLGPVKATLDTSKYGTALTSGDFRDYQGEMRNIVLTLGLEPDFTADESVASLRQALYSWFSPLASVMLELESDNMATVRINGWVESAEPDIFAQDPTIVISIICPIGYFIDPVQKVVSGASVSGTSRFTINYAGSVPNGFWLDADVVGSAKFLNISNTSDGDDEIFSIVYSTTTNMPYGVLDLSTIPGSKRYILTPASTGVAQSLLSYIDSVNNKWPILKPGPNSINIRTLNDGSVTYDLKYYEVYGGL